MYIVQSINVNVIAEFDDVTNAELHPLLTVLKVIKDEYSYVRPEVYRTLIALLHDYNPSFGEEHRNKVIYTNFFMLLTAKKKFLLKFCRPSVIELLL